MREQNEGTTGGNPRARAGGTRGRRGRGADRKRPRAGARPLGRTDRDHAPDARGAASRAPRDRPLVNEIKSEIEARIEALAETMRWPRWSDRSARRRIDVTLPGVRIPRGRLHPMTQTTERMLDIFVAMGFEVVATQDIEDDFHNFGALNFPPDHPAREMQDTFFLPGGLLLRTHTSNGQIRVMERRKPPLAVVCPGNCYRRDELSVRASPMFSQIEGFMVDRAGVVTMAHLKGVLDRIRCAHSSAPTPRSVSARASFPFTEPSAEVDINCVFCHGAGCRVCKQTGWTEILGSGMIHPNVLRAVGYDPARVPGLRLRDRRRASVAAQARRRRHAPVFRKRHALSELSSRSPR